MLNVFSLANGRLVQEEIDSLQALAHLQPVWVDLDALPQGISAIRLIPCTHTAPTIRHRIH